MVQYLVRKDAEMHRVELIRKFIDCMQKDIPADGVCSASPSVGNYLVLGTVKKCTCTAIHLCFLFPIIFYYLLKCK